MRRSMEEAGRGKGRKHRMGLWERRWAGAGGKGGQRGSKGAGIAEGGKWEGTSKEAKK